MTGSSVMFVQAQDPDRGENGTLEYSIVQNTVRINNNRDYFKIDKNSGLIRTNVDKRFLDREQVPAFALRVSISFSIILIP